MMIQGYLTLPRGQDVRTIPLVVNVHGGPFNRLTGDNTKRSQFLANRGYGVFEPNFRASEGFGRKYMLAANRDFGNGRVQLDINEGVEYILSRGIGDKNKLAIIGASFGGFSALTGLTFTPNLYQVGFAIAPGTALTKTVEFFLKQTKEDEKMNMVKMFADRIVDVNDPVDVKRSDEKSPYFHLEKISKPLYILAGERDTKVSILNVRNYALQLEALGKDVTLLSAPKEGHSFSHPTAVEAVFYLLEKALHTHIGGRMQKDLSPKAVRFLKKNILISPKNKPDKKEGIHHVSVI
jgi:dipeptidyl aminopeptidase/acylaminoacyl peptidase